MLGQNTKDIKYYRSEVTFQEAISYKCIRQVFKSKAIAVGSPTVYQGILSSVSGWLEFLKELKFRGKKAAVFGCYGWSGESNQVLCHLMKEAGFETVDAEIKCSWNPREEDLEKAKEVARQLLDS